MSRIKLSNWDSAIAYVEARIQKLQRAREVFKAGKQSGDPWPGVEGETEKLLSSRP